MVEIRGYLKKKISVLFFHHYPIFLAFDGILCGSLILFRLMLVFWETNSFVCLPQFSQASRSPGMYQTLWGVPGLRSTSTFPGAAIRQFIQQTVSGCLQMQILIRHSPFYNTKRGRNRINIYIFLPYIILFYSNSHSNIFTLDSVINCVSSIILLYIILL